MTTANKILDFLIKRFPNTYISIDTTHKVLRRGNKIKRHSIYIASYKGFKNSPISKEFKTIKDLGKYIKEHFKDK